MENQHIIEDANHTVDMAVNNLYARYPNGRAISDRRIEHVKASIITTRQQYELGNMKFDQYESIVNIYKDSLEGELI